MSREPQFQEAYPFQDDILAIPVTDLDTASRQYGERFGMAEVERLGQPAPAVILERDGIRIGFAINGGDSSQDGAAVLVSNIQDLEKELEAAGVDMGNWRVDDRDGPKCQLPLRSPRSGSARWCVGRLSKADQRSVRNILATKMNLSEIVI